MSTRRSRKTYSTKQATGTNGKPACLECGGDITQKRRRTFCGTPCADAFQIRTSPHFARLKVFERDKGICAGCGIDVFAGQSHGNGRARTRRSRGSGDLWQADHILPVVEGGGECGLQNLQTLCTACHKLATKNLHGRIKQRRIDAKSLPLLDTA